MIPTGDGGWRQPTVRDALEALERDRFVVLTEEDSYDPRAWQGSPYDPAVAILRQVFGPHPDTELAGLADRLAEVMADTTLHRYVRNNAASALRSAADPESNRGGTFYPRAFDVLVRVYESGTDGALSSIFWADRERGPAYLRDLFERSERPAFCFGGHYRSPGDPPDCVGDPGKTPWCRAGDILYRKIVAEASRRTWPSGVIMETAGEPRPMPDGL